MAALFNSYFIIKKWFRGRQIREVEDRLLRKENKNPSFEEIFFPDAADTLWKFYSCDKNFLLQLLAFIFSMSDIILLTLSQSHKCSLILSVSQL